MDFMPFSSWCWQCQCYLPSSQISFFSPCFFSNSFSFHPFVLLPSPLSFWSQRSLCWWLGHKQPVFSYPPKPCSRNHRPIAATRKTVGKYTQQVSSRISIWRVGCIYRVSHVKLPTCKFIAKSKEHSHRSILSSCLGWQVTFSLKNPKQTKNPNHQKPHNPPTAREKKSNSCGNPKEKPKLNWKAVIIKLCRIWRGWQTWRTHFYTLHVDQWKGELVK